MFGWFKKRSSVDVPPILASVEQASVQEAEPENEPESMQEQGNDQTSLEVLRDPKRVATWAERVMILGTPWEDNFSMLPDEEFQRAIGLTFEQKERIAKEYHILGIAGVLLFLRYYYFHLEEFGKYEVILNDLAGRLARALELDRSEVGQVLDDYVRYKVDAEAENIETLYMGRIYNGNPNFNQMLEFGIGEIADEYISTSFQVFSDAIEENLIT